MNAPLLSYLFEHGAGRCAASFDLDAVANTPRRKLQSAVTWIHDGTVPPGQWPAYFGWWKAIWQTICDTSNYKFCVQLKAADGRPIAVEFRPRRKARKHFVL